MSRKVFSTNEYVRDTDGKLVYGLVCANALRTDSVSVSGSPTKLPSNPLSKRKFIEIFNNSGDIIYIGDATVSTSNGRPIYPRASQVIYIEEELDIYGISSGTNSDVRVMEGA